jgi:hypothetical protein
MARFQWRRNTAAGAASNNAVLAAGEPGVTTDTHVLKVGDGATAWVDLPEVGSRTYARLPGTGAATFDETTLAYPSRPSTASVVWYGPRLPTGATAGDVWAFRPPTIPRQVIVDTDSWTDPDDAKAFRLLGHATRLGLIDLRAVVQDVKCLKGPGAISALLEAEGLGAVSIGAHASYIPSGGTPTWQGAVYDVFPHRLGLWATVPTSTEVYRRALTEAPNASVDIISIGYLVALQDLLSSAGDSIDSRTGAQLVAAKVRHLWVMGGYWPSGPENNFNRDSTAKTAANAVVAAWPSPITFLGFEVGTRIITGGILAGTTATDPIAYILNQQSVATGDPSWDEMLTWLACLQDPTTAGYTAVTGTATVNASTGFASFTPSGGGAHRYVVKAASDRWFTNDLQSRMVVGRDPMPSIPPGVLAGVQIQASQRSRAPLTPTAIPARTTTLATDLVAHFDADDLSGLTVGDKVTHWSDRMLTHPVRQLTTANQPTLGSTAGKNCVHFVGSQSLVGDTFSWPSATFTVYVRCYFGTLPSGTAQYLCCADDSQSAARIFGLQIGTTALPIGLGYYPHSTGTACTGSTALTGSTWQTVGVRANASQVQVFLDGAFATATTGRSGQNTGWQALAIGSRYTDSLALTLTGEIREVRVYQAYHDDATVAAVTAAMNV